MGPFKRYTCVVAKCSDYVHVCEWHGFYHRAGGTALLLRIQLVGLYLQNYNDI